MKIVLSRAVTLKAVTDLSEPLPRAVRIVVVACRPLRNFSDALGRHDILLARPIALLIAMPTEHIPHGWQVTHGWQVAGGWQIAHG